MSIDGADGKRFENIKVTINYDTNSWSKFSTDDDALSYYSEKGYELVQVVKKGMTCDMFFKKEH